MYSAGLYIYIAPAVTSTPFLPVFLLSFLVPVSARGTRLWARSAGGGTGSVSGPVISDNSATGRYLEQRRRNVIDVVGVGSREPRRAAYFCAVGAWPLDREGDTRILEKWLKRGPLGAKLLRIQISRLSFIIRGSVPRVGGSNTSRSFNDPDGGTR